MVIMDLTFMELSRMIAELRAERAVITAAIAVLERLAQTGQGKRRGRPPAWLSIARGSSGITALSSNTQPKVKRHLSAEVKRRMAEAQRKRWAAYRKAKAADTKS